MKPQLTDQELKDLLERIANGKIWIEAHGGWSSRDSDTLDAIRLWYQLWDQAGTEMNRRWKPGTGREDLEASIQLKLDKARAILEAKGLVKPLKKTRKKGGTDHDSIKRQSDTLHTTPLKF
jgi:hypothetical protein